MQAILIADDDTAIGDLEQEVLERAGYAVQRAYSGTEYALLKAAITNVSHDLRTPLTAVCGYLDLLEQEPHSDASQRYLAIIRECTDAMRSLTGELFRYSVITATAEELTPEPVSLRGSTGLGLSIAKLLTEKMGGCITASCRGGVLCICIRFPEQTSPIPT